MACHQGAVLGYRRDLDLGALGGELDGDWFVAQPPHLAGLSSRSPERPSSGTRSPIRGQTLGISRDSPWTHIAWMQALDLSFPLLSDWNAEAVHAFGVAHDFRGFEDVAERTAFLANRSGTVRGAWRYETAAVPDMNELLAAARGLRDSAHDPEPRQESG